ncbi:MAG: hypothetical protein ACJAVI_005644, partial [Candidatus Azotimanducaceae bacterium]
VIAGQSVIQNTDVILTTQGGDISVVAGTTIAVETGGAASSNGGDIVYSAETDLIVGDVDASGADSTTAAGSIVIRSTRGNVTVNDQNNDGIALISNGRGDILIDAGASIHVNADIGAESGNVSLVAVTDINQFANIKTDGGTIDLQTGANLLMTDGAQAASSGGSISIGAVGDITIAAVDAGTGNVVIVSATGSILDGGDTDTDIISSGLILTAASNIGTTINALEITVDQVSAASATGDIALTETDDIVIDAVSVEINRVNGVGQDSSIITVEQSDLQTSESGIIVLRTLNGDITLNDGDNDGESIVSPAGTALLQAAGVDANLIINASVISAGSALSLIAEGSVLIGSNVVVVNGNSSIDIEATTGSVMMSDTASIRSNGGNVSVMALGDITLGGIDAQTGSITIVSVTGRVLDSGDTFVDLKASSIKIRAGSNIGGAGASTNPIDIEVDNVTAFSDAGDIYLQTSASLTVDSISVTVQRVDENGNTSDIVGSAQNDIQTNGLSNVSVVAVGDITLASGAKVSTAGASVELESTAGSIVMADASSAISATGSVRIAAAGDVIIGGVEAFAGNVSIISFAGNILDGGDTFQDVSALGLRLNAAGDIGEVGVNVDSLEISVNSVSAVTSGGNINLLSSGDITVDAVAVTVRRADEAGVFGFIEDAAQSDLQTSGSGIIILATVDGDITINDGNDIEEASASQRATSLVGDIGDGNGIVTEAGNILILAGGAGNNILVNADILTEAGVVSVIAQNSVSLTSGADIRTLNSSVDLQATDGVIVLDDDSLVSSQGGNVRLIAAGDVVLGGIAAGTGSVSIFSATGKVLDGGDIYTDVAAQNLLVTAGDDIGKIEGVSDSIEISVDGLTVNSEGGDINLVESDDLTVKVLTNTVSRVSADGATTSITDEPRNDIQTSGDGNIVLVFGGELTVTSSDTDAAGLLTEMGDISVVGTGVTLVAAIASTEGNITVEVANDLTLEARGNITTGGAGAISLTAFTGDIDMQEDSSIQSGSGDVQLTSGGDLLLTRVLSGSGDVSLIASGRTLDNSLRELANVETQGNLVIESQEGVGLVTEDLDTAVSSVTVNNGLAGDIVIDQVGQLLITGTGIVNGNTEGSISLKVTTGTLTIDAPIRAAGDITITAPRIIISTAVTTVAGDIIVTATDTDVVLEGAAATIQTDTGRIAITAEEDVLLTVVNSGGLGISITATNGSIVDNLPGESSNLVTSGNLEISAGKDIGQVGDGNINIDTGTLNIMSINGDSISIEFDDGREFSGTAESLYAITNKRSYEPQVTTRLTPDSLRQVYEVEPSGTSIDDLLEEERMREFLGKNFLATRAAGSLLEQNADQLRLSLRLLASGSGTLAEGYNQALAAELQLSLEK